MRKFKDDDRRRERSRDAMREANKVGGEYFVKISHQYLEDDRDKCLEKWTIKW